MGCEQMRNLESLSMANLIELKDAAQMLGVDPAELNDMRTRGDVYGYRDGATWKFKQDELERAATNLGVSLKPLSSDQDQDADLDEMFDVTSLDEGGEDSVLLSEEEIGQSGDTTSSTIIGKGDAPVADAGKSDIELAGDASGASDVKLVSGGSDVLAGASNADADDLITGASDVELDDDIALGGSDLTLAGADDAELDLDAGSSDIDFASDDSVIDLDTMDDGDMLLGSSIGSDVTSGAGDSGISLTTPADSGLSLEEEPLELGAASDIESLELGEDDMIALEEDNSDPDAATQLKRDDEFLLTPVEGDDGDEQDSGSQVIALDTDEFDEAAQTLLADEGLESPMPGALLEEEPDLLAQGAPADLGQTAPGLMQQALPETPYSVWNVLGLICVLLFLSVCGVMMYDLVRHIWSWDQPYALNSSIMDAIIDTFF